MAGPSGNPCGASTATRTPASRSADGDHALRASQIEKSPVPVSAIDGSCSRKKNTIEDAP